MQMYKIFAIKVQKSILIKANNRDRGKMDLEKVLSSSVIPRHSEGVLFPIDSLQYWRK
jgi:hypothetical protein